ncbi:MAG: zinc ribbon domain-containing protein [bacterium]
MKEKIRLLWQLEEIDEALQKSLEERNGLDDGSALKAKVDALREELERQTRELREMRREMEDKELEARGLEERRRSMESRMYGGYVSNPKELESMEREVEMLRRNQDRLEERVLELMYAIEDKSGEIKKLEEQLREEDLAYQKVRSNYEREYKRLSEKIATLEEKRKELLPQIDPALLARYKEIREREGGGVGKVVRGVCSGCGFSVSPRLLARLKEGEGLVYCENCGRILYLEE